MPILDLIDLWQWLFFGKYAISQIQFKNKCPSYLLWCIDIPPYALGYGCGLGRNVAQAKM